MIISIANGMITLFLLFGAGRLRFQSCCNKILEFKEEKPCGRETMGKVKQRLYRISLSAIFQQDCPSYGLGLWRDKEIELENIITKYLLVDIGQNPRMIHYLWKKSKSSYQQYIEGILCGKNPIFWKDDGSIRLCDTVRTIYAVCAKKYFVAPKVTKSRTWGLDGSGENMKKKKMDPCTVWELDTDQDFEFRISFDTEKVDRYNKYIFGCIGKVQWLYIFKARIKYLLYSINKRVISK